MIVASFLWSIPEAADLVEVSGHLQSFHIYYAGRGSKGIVIETDAGACCTFAITEQRARDLLRYRGLPVRFYVDARSRHPISGWPRAYGLSVKGVEVQSVIAALHEERVGVRTGFPLFRLFLIVLSVLIYWRSNRSHLTKRWSQRLTGEKISK